MPLGDVVVLHVPFYGEYNDDDLYTQRSWDQSSNRGSSDRQSHHPDPDAVFARSMGFLLAFFAPDSFPRSGSSHNPLTKEDIKWGINVIQRS